jgi:predicted ATPase
MQEAAETSGDSDLLIVGDLAALTSYYWLGDPVKTLEHADRVLALYIEDRHAHLVGMLNHDPKSLALIISAISTWMLGYPEQTAQMIDAAHDHARRRGHPFNLGWSLTTGAHVFDFLGEPEAWLKRTEEAERLGRETSLHILTEMFVPIWSGIALIRKGQAAEGTALLERGVALYEEVGGRVVTPYMRSRLAEGVAQLGDLAAALALIGKAIVQIERPGWEERQYYAEALRVKGWLLSLKGDPAGAERSYITSLDWARRQQAKSWELRTATSYARLLRDQGRVSDACELLAPVYSWFTEGFDTADLKEAEGLLNDLR